MLKNIPVCFMIGFCLIFASCKEKDAASKSGSNPDAFSNDTASINAANRSASALVRKNPDSALLYLNKTMKHSYGINYEYGIGEAFRLSGLANFYRYRYDTALYLYNKAYEIFEKIHSKRGMAQTLFSMSYAYSLKSDLPNSLECAENAKTLYEEINDFYKVYDCIDGLIYIHQQLNNPRVVDTLMNELVKVAGTLNDKKKLANSYIILGNHFADQAYLNLAIENYYKALKIAEESGDSVEIANAMGSIGLANLYLYEYQTAINYYLKQEAILKSTGDNYELSKTYTGLGEGFNALRNFDKGLEYHLKALALREKMHYSPAISNSLYNIGYTYYLMEDSADLALRYISRSLQIDQEVMNYNGIAQNYMLSGKIHILKKNFPAAIILLEKALTLAKENNNPDVIMETSGALCILYANQGEYRKAYDNMHMNNEISDSLVSGRNLKRITQLEMQHAFDKKQSEIEVAHLQEKLQFETKLKRNKLVRNYSLVIGSMIVAFGAFMYYSYRKSRKAEKEKEALLKEIHHRVKNNLMVISSLLNLQSGTLQDDNTRYVMKESQSRVKSMALIHELLYQSELFTSIDFSKYLELLMASLQSAYSRPDLNIGYVIRADDIRLDIDTALPLGLITNELATNAFKYAFTDSTAGTITIDLHRIRDHQYMLRIADDGKGLPPGFDVESSGTLGLKLVKLLTRQIKAKLGCKVNCGTEFEVVFTENI